MPLRQPTIGIITRGSFAEYDSVFQAVGDLYDCQFIQVPDTDRNSCDAYVFVGFTRAEAVKVTRPERSCLIFAPQAPFDAALRIAQVEFADSEAVPAAFRGCTLLEPGNRRTYCVVTEPGDEVLAKSGGQAIWLRANCGSSSIHVVGHSLPPLPASGRLCSMFTPECWYAILPLLVFTAGVSGWVVPTPRACFILDDPNLHWPSYGYVDYEQIAMDAELTNYHVAFATVPLDGWYINESVADCFQRHERRLSLLIHGNGHTKRELAARSDDHRLRAIALQSLARTAQIERRAKVKVDRIMVPPHNACSGPMASALQSVGFHGAVIFRDAMMQYTPEVNWPRTVGLTPCEVLGGLPIMPRFGLRGELETRTRLCSFLGQAVFFSGHHGDLREGLQILRDIAAVLNRVPGMRWESSSQIAATRYWTRRRRDEFDIRLFGRWAELDLPDSVRVVNLVQHGSSEVQSAAADELQPSLTHDESGNRVRRVMAGAFPEALTPAFSSGFGKFGNVSLKAIVRRQMCEMRDRISPLFGKFVR